MKKFLLLIVLIALVNDNLFAASGCLRAGQVYRNPPSGLNGWSSPIQDNCPSGASTSTQYAEVNSIGGSCSIGFLGLGGSGTLVNYDIEFCPIDAYIPLMLLLTGGIAIYFLRKELLCGSGIIETKFI